MIQKQLNELKPDFAKIINEKLDIKKEQLKDYKPLKCAEIPKFDQETQYVVQSIPLDGKDSINVGIEVREMVKDDADINDRLTL